MSTRPAADPAISSSSCVPSSVSTHHQPKIKQPDEGEHPSASLHEAQADDLQDAQDLTHAGTPASDR
jgi:hypothetical protein